MTMTNDRDAFLVTFRLQLSNQVFILRQAAAWFTGASETTESVDPAQSRLLAMSSILTTMAAALTGHGGPQECAELRRFLDSTPDFVADLQRMITHSESLWQEERDRRLKKVITPGETPS